MRCWYLVLSSPPTRPRPDDVVDLAASLIGRPYEWGAEGPKTFDCSGLTQYVYSRFGVDLPRRAINQSDFGEPTRRLQRGDLVFFSSGAGQSVVTHVGIYEAHGTMIDASKRYGRVRRDDLNDPYWTATFVFARRVTDNIARQDDAGDDFPRPEPSRPRDRRTSGRGEAARRSDGSRKCCCGAPAAEAFSQSRSVAHCVARPSFRNASSGGYVLSGASMCGTWPRPGSRSSRAFPLGIVSAR